MCIRNGKMTLRPEVQKLPVYVFSESDMIKVDQVHFLRNVSLGIPRNVIQVKKPVEIVRAAVLRRASMSNLKVGFSKKDAQKFRSLLNDMPSETFYQEITGLCGCSMEQAKIYTDDFIRQAGDYLQAEDVDSNVLSSALEHCPKLLEKCKELNESAWRKENDALLKEAQDNLKDLRNKASQEGETYRHLQEQQKEIEDRIQAIEEEIDRKEQLAVEVEEKVADRIAAAKQNAADFICEMAFIQPGMISQPTGIPASEPILFQSGRLLEKDLLEHHETWDAVCAIQDELKEAGVSNKYISEIAAFLYAAYISRSPLLLAGPNGRDIADALSSALFGRTASVLYTEEAYTIDIKKKCEEDEGKILVVLNPLRAGWIDHISELSAIKNKFLIGVHPFAEDLMIEPKGLYHYMLPVLTELFVSHAASGEYIGGYFSREFQENIQAKPQKKIPFAKTVSMSLLTQNRLRQILADMKSIIKSDSSDYDFIFGTFPYAYAIGKGCAFWEKIRESTQLSQKAKEMLEVFLGEDT